MRGEQADFDGYGLTLRWDGQNQIIQLLEIAHGERAVMKKPAVEAEASGTPAATAPSAPPTPATASASEAPVPAVLQPADVAATTTASSQPAPSSQEVQEKIIVYRATLKDNLRIEQAGQTLATGDLLTIDFLASSGGSGDADDSPAIKPSVPTTTAAPVEPAPAATSVTPVAPTTDPTTASTAPTTQSQAAPITLYWTGPLRIVPNPGPTLAPLTKGQAVAELSGQAVAIQFAGSNVTAG
jgi:hypothetical protein